MANKRYVGEFVTFQEYQEILRMGYGAKRMLERRSEARSIQECNGERSRVESLTGQIESLTASVKLRGSGARMKKGWWKLGEADPTPPSSPSWTLTRVPSGI